MMPFAPISSMSSVEIRSHPIEESFVVIPPVAVEAGAEASVYIFVNCGVYEEAFLVGEMEHGTMVEGRLCRGPV